MARRKCKIKLSSSLSASLDSIEDTVSTDVYKPSKNVSLERQCVDNLVNISTENSDNANGGINDSEFMDFLNHKVGNI